MAFDLSMIPNLLQAGSSALMAPAQLLQTFQANQANQARYDQGFEELDALRRRNQGRLDTAATTANTMAGGIAQAGDQGWGDILSQFDTGANALRQDIAGSGAQEAADIDRAYRAQGSNVAQDLASRGLSGSTILPGARLGVERERVGSQGRLQQRLRDARINLGQNLLSGRTGLAERALGQRLGGQAGILDTFRSGEAARSGADVSGTGSLVNWIGNREDVAPDEGTYLNLLSNAGSSLAPRASTPSASLLGPLIGAGGTAAGLTGLGLGLGAGGGGQPLVRRLWQKRS